MLRIKLIKSTIGNTPRNRATVAGLGLRKTGSVVEHNDTPEIRGMIHHVKHLLHVEEVEGTVTKSQGPKKGPMAAKSAAAAAPAKAKRTTKKKSEEAE
ncbi:MAG: 50S ribosomal protein L30 [Chthonomonas sp.]|nr:50S ribosomal protein L30 [Chthonomonas sp.]